MNKDKLLEYLEIMCKICINYNLCQELHLWSECTPRNEIRKFIEEKGE